MNFSLRLPSELFAGIKVGDELVIDGGMALFEVIEKLGSDLRCKCTDPGLFLPRAKFSFWRDGKLVERNYELPTLSTKVSIHKIFLHFVFQTLWPINECKSLNFTR